MVIDYYDTSALLALDNIEATFNIGHNYISHFCLAELETIKTSANKSEETKARARKVARFMLANPTTFFYDSYDERKIEKARKKHYFPDNMDGRILAEVTILARKNLVRFWTADINMSIFAREAGLEVHTIAAEEKQEEPFSGWNKYYPSEQEFSMLYTDPKMNILGAKINEYCILYQDTEVRDILRWDGEEYQHLNYKPITSAVGQKWKPLNTEQKLLFDMLQNDDIPIKLALGNFGSGKTSLMLTHALDMVQKGKMDRIVFVRNNTELRDTTPLGALPGDEWDKISWMLSPVIDHVGQYAFEDMVNQGIIEATHLGFCRGRDFKRTILFCDECENLTVHQVQLLIGRIGKESMLFMAGDLRQTDRPIFDTNSGIRKMIERLKGEKLFSVVKLIKSERSEVCRLADNLD